MEGWRFEYGAAYPALKFDYDDPTWRTETFRCPVCGWAGKEPEMSADYYADLSDRSCPVCDKMLLILAYPRDRPHS